MKVFTLLAFFLAINSCNEENKYTSYPKEKIMNHEQFDVNSFEKYQDEQEKLPFPIGDPSSRTTEHNGTIITESSSFSSKEGKEYEKRILKPVPELFWSVTYFYENGRIKESVDRVFIGALYFKYGIRKFYDRNGILTKIVDYNKRFDHVNIKLDKLLEILQNERLKIEEFDKETEYQLKARMFENEEIITPQMIIDALKEIFTKESDHMKMGNFEEYFLNPYNREDAERIYIDFDEDEKIWYVTKDFSSFGKINLKVDANTGKIMERNYSMSPYEN